ncbi:hypothetical protein Cri9333_0625 [Crinalium epipsammum PCC 9333]|uniref:Uncharacterized protein n=1 Tax=Crinalium epipsammum PCC 9333 TaxID=1173022 RepID=K9VU08_9CYAN|nr:hypothetical protein [Crinalium epipsammum]AFZ11568.1 hypothetical protein Cri9333_0625 [Crinalium epipsammum PCC 9333]
MLIKTYDYKGYTIQIEQPCENMWAIGIVDPNDPSSLLIYDQGHSSIEDAEGFAERSVDFEIETNKN